MLHWLEIERGERWQLIRGQMAVVLGSIQCFNTETPTYYGTWEDRPGRPGGRTGAMGDLAECKARVEQAVNAA